MNRVFLCGRFVSYNEFTTESDKKIIDVLIAVPRSYKNEEGIYDTDFINCRLFSAIAEHTIEYCKKGDLIGLSGSLHSEKVDMPNGTIEYHEQVYVDKVSFLANATKDESGVEND
jgi:single-strand DNA-binding protein